MITALLNSSSALIFAGLGALLTELSGTLGIFIDGFMSLGAFLSFAIAGWTGSVFWGTMSAAVIIGAMGFVLSIFVEKSGANAFVVGLALNIAAGGICNSLSMFFFGTQGIIRNENLNVDVSGHMSFVFLSAVIAGITFIMINKTKAGLALRASGISVDAAMERGLNPMMYRAVAWGFAAALAALGGADLSFRIGVYTPGIVAGRGWIALALVYLGFKNVWGVVAAALVFALIEQMGIRLQGMGLISGTVTLGIPPMLACILFAITQIVSLRKNGTRKG
jgi:simple sugar transport system permease protein